MIVDAHTHIWPRWPYIPEVPDPLTRGSAENLLFELDRNGVDRALVVTARIERAADNVGYGADAASRHPDRLVHVADFDSRWSADYHRPGSADRLRSLIDEHRPAGISHYLAPATDDWLRSSDADAVFSLAAEHGMIVSLAAPSVWLDEVRMLARRHPSVPFLVNHLGVVMLHPGGIDEGLRLVLDEEHHQNLLVKVSGYYYGSERPWDYPYREGLAIVRAFSETWGVDRMVWASDWPSLLPHHSYRQALQVLREHADFLTPAEIDRIQGGTLAALLDARAGAAR
jgi:L-fuconolactonase